MGAERRSGVDDRKHTFESFWELPGSGVGYIDALEFCAVRRVTFLEGRDFGAAGGTGGRTRREIFIIEMKRASYPRTW